MDWIAQIYASLNSSPADDRSLFQRDADRIVFSSAFRRLQQKTQVHPHPQTDYVRTRLTHSMEVASVGRSLAGQVARRLAKQSAGLPRDLAADFGDIVAAACLAHDIGNPPFGHAGEAAIQSWFDANRTVFGGELSPAQEADFLKFEGNAQGFRILTRLQMDRNAGGMRLTPATLAAFSKYPCASDAREKGGYIGRKKHGFMQSEQAIFAANAAAMLTPALLEDRAWHRHPLVYLVEAADDICYRIIDVEDGVKLGRIRFGEAEDICMRILGPGALSERYKQRSDDEKLSTLRSMVIGSLVAACRDAFVDPANGFLDGSAAISLIEATALSAEAEQLKDMALERVYRWERTVMEEVKGIQVLNDLLDRFVTAAVGGGGAVLRQRLVSLVPHFPKDAPRYERLLAVTDYISGMTDRYAAEMQGRLR